MFEPVKIGFGRSIMQPWFKDLAATTRPMRAYLRKPFEEAVFIAPSRMVDAAEDMLNKYMRLDRNEPTKPHFLPVTMFGFAKDYTPTGRDYTRQVADGEYIQFPNDPKQRLFRIKTIAGDLRVQVVFFASDEPTARSMAAQFLLFLDRTDARRFWVDYTFAGVTNSYPVQIELPDSPAMNVPSERQNLCILACDFTLKAQIPLFTAPKDDEPNDGQGTPGDPDDPSGYPLTVLADINGERRVTWP